MIAVEAMQNANAKAFRILRHGCPAVLALSRPSDLSRHGLYAGRDAYCMMKYR